MTKHVRLFDLGFVGTPEQRSELLTSLIAEWACVDFGIARERLCSQYNVSAMAFDQMGRMWVSVELFVEHEVVRKQQK